MTRSSSCWRHPAKSVVGVCASCLRERLIELSSAEERHASPKSCSFEEQDSASAEAETCDELGNTVTVSKLLEADHVEAEYVAATAAARDRQSPRSAVLQRTHSWSHHRQLNGYSTTDLGKACRILTAKENSLLHEHSLPESFIGTKSGMKFSDFAETPKGHIKASSWPEIDSEKRHHQQQQQGKSSWLWSLLGLRSKGSSSSSTTNNNKVKKSLFGLGKKKSKPNTAPDPFQDILSSPWQSGKLEREEADDFSDLHGRRGARNEQGHVTNRVTPLSSNGDVFNSKLSKMNSVNGSRQERYSSTRPPRDGWSKVLSTPLRVFKGGHSKKSRDGLDFNVDDDKRSWGVTSPKRFHPSPAFPSSASYTPYYRDYGASWSLHSSPMPGKGRHYRGGNSRPWENRDAFHTHSSPFHPAGGNTWNFYLTPVRPVRSSTSRHRP